MSDRTSGSSFTEPEPLDITPGRVDEGVREAPSDDHPTRSRRRTIVLGSLLAIGLAGVAAFSTAGWRIAAQKDAKLDTPDRIAGLARDDSERARATADYLRTALAAYVDLDNSIGAVYADPAGGDRSVLLVGGTTLLWQPDRDLDRLFELVGDDTGKVAGLRELPPGDLGGVMKCGTSTAEQGNVIVCGWADHGSVVMALFPGRGVDESAALLRDVRAAVQTRQ